MIAQSLCAQDRIIDSLNTALKNHKAKDTTRVSILNHLAFSHYSIDPPKAMAYVDEAFAIAKEIKSENKIAHCYYIKAIVFSGQSDFKEALKNYNKAIDLYTKLKDYNGLKKCNNAMGVLYEYQGELDLALKHYETALDFEKKAGNGTGDKSILYNMSNVYIDKGDFQKALKNLFEVLKINKELGDSSGIVNCYNSIGLVYYQQSNYPLSLKYHNQSLHIGKRIKDSIGIFRSYTNIGNIYRQQDLNDKALDYYNMALSIESAKYNIKNVTALKNNMAGIYYDEKQLDKAITLFKESIELSKEIDDDVNLTTAYNGLGFVYYEAKNYQQAINCFNDALNLCLENDYLYDVLDAYDGLAETYFDLKQYDLALENALKMDKSADYNQSLKHKKNAASLFARIYEKKGLYKEALESHKAYKIFNDSLFNEENVEKITALEYEYKYKAELENAKDKELKLTETVKITSSDLEKSQRNLLLGIILFLAITVLLGGVIFYLRLKNVNEKTQNIITEQKLLRSQMTPHFIFNAMSVLQGIILNKEDKKAVTYLSKFSKLLRLTLENSREQMVSLNNELLAIENYIELQNIEATTPYHYSIEVDSAIDKEKFKIPPMLIQPFIENAIEHGFIKQQEEKQIDITISFSNSTLICIIRDNGVGIETEQPRINHNKKSLSTAITSERLELLSKNAKNKGSVKIEDRKKYNDQGTVVTLVIPYNNDPIT